MTRLLHSPSRMLIAAGAALLPWTLVLSGTLPETYEARNWSTAWVGLDLAIAAGAIGTGLLHRAGDRRAVPLAAATSTAALVDLWFDVLTSAPGRPLATALACGVVELAFAGYCARIALARDDDRDAGAEPASGTRITSVPADQPTGGTPGRTTTV